MTDPHPICAPLQSELDELRKRLEQLERGTEICGNDLLERVETLETPAPIPMVMHCPECKTRHIDVGEFATKPHHTHSCQSCGFTWRPTTVPTVGVQFLPGFKNPQPSQSQPDEPQGVESVEAFAARMTESNWRGLITGRDAAIRADERRNGLQQFEDYARRINDDLEVLRARAESAERERDELRAKLVATEGDLDRLRQVTRCEPYSYIKALTTERDQLRSELDRARAVVEARQMRDDFDMTRGSRTLFEALRAFDTKGEK